MLKEINVPIYATKLTTAIIENKLKEHNLIKGTKRKVVVRSVYKPRVLSWVSEPTTV